MSSIASHVAQTGVGASSIEVGAGGFEGVRFFKPARRGQSSLVYAAEFVDGREPTGHGWREPRQWLSPSKQAHHETAKDPVSFAKQPTPTPKMPLTPSFAYLAMLLSQIETPPDQLTPVGQTSAAVAKDAKGQILEDLRALAQWLRLRDPMLPHPLVGDIDSDPLGIADQYGTKGESVLTAFVDVDADVLSCHVCGFKTDTLEAAVIHQEEERHFWS